MNALIKEKKMSRRDVKTINIFHEAPYKMENEPEEGEIVDDYDLIVSSDEELCMRQRIRELEEENEEIEQIAVISRCYDKINSLHTHIENNRAAQVPTDASSISSTEFVTPKKRKRRKSKEYKRKHCHHQHQHHLYDYEHTRFDQQQQQISFRTRNKKTHCKRRQKIFAKKHQKMHSDRYTYKDINTESLSLDSHESSDSSTDSLADNADNNNKRKDEESFDHSKHINRDILRLAVARNSNESTFSSKNICLKDKLLRQDLVGQSTHTAFHERLASKNQNQNNEEDDDDDVHVIENDPDIQIVDDDSTDSLDEKQLRLIALKSAVVNKHLARKKRDAEAAYSPTDFDNKLDDIDNKLDDIELADLEAEDFQNVCITVSPEASPQLVILDDEDESQPMVDCKPVDMDIANSDIEDTTVESWTKEADPMIPTFSLPQHDFVSHFQYGFYMPDLHELPPPPPCIDDYEDVQPPPPPYHQIYNPDTQDMELANEELTESKVIFKTSANFVTQENNASSLQPIACQKYNNDDEEDENALRALLLSKFQSPKNQKKSKRSIEIDECTNIVNNNELYVQSVNNAPTNPSEFILKEAVKRLKIHSQTDYSKEEFTEDLNKQSINNLSTNALECGDKYKHMQKLRTCSRFMKPEQFQEVNCKEDYKKEIFLGQQFLDPTDNPINKIYEDNRTHEYPTSFSSSTEVTNKIDIFVIDRRLKEIEENVRNSTNKQTPKDAVMISHYNPQLELTYQESDNGFKKTETLKVENEPSLENIEQLHNNNIFSDTANDTCNIYQATLNEKKVEDNFNVDTNQTSFKVTICNSKSTKLENIDLKDVKNDVSTKENKTNNVTKNVKLKVNVNAKNKDSISSGRLVKIINKTKETLSKADTKSMEVKHLPLIKPIAVAAPTSALLRTATKIVKPNKVINANFDINRRQVLPAAETSTKSTTKNETSNQPSIKSDNLRLITSIDQVKHMYKIEPFIISVQNSSNESSEDEWGRDYDSLCKPLYDYNDNASPLSLNLESPSRTPVRSNSPTEQGVNGNTKNGDLNSKLNTSDVTVLKTSRIINKTQETKGTDENKIINNTPLAVRHLPAKAQNEYRTLIHRMKLLENKRKSNCDGENKTNCRKNISKKKETNLSVTNQSDQTKDKDKLDGANHVPKSSLVKKVLINNASNSTTPNKKEESQTLATQKFHKTNVLKSYENLYVKFGAGIVNNLDKSLKLVEEARKAKIEKLKLELRLKELKTEMDILQGKHKEESQKISCIYPSMCSTNDVITSLKQKRSKVFKAANTLGKTLKGEDYRLNNDLKESINMKSKLLASEIKRVNSLKVQDIKKMEEIAQASNVTKDQIDNKKKEVEVVKTKSNNEQIETKINANTAITTNYMEEKTTREMPLQLDDGGNTEFQNLKSNKTKSCEQSDENVYQIENEIKLDTLEEINDNKESLPSYISPLEHLRNINSNVDPNGVVCPYDLMGNCEDVTCKYIHISIKANIL